MLEFEPTTCTSPAKWSNHSTTTPRTETNPYLWSGGCLKLQPLLHHKHGVGAVRDHELELVRERVGPVVVVTDAVLVDVGHGEGQGRGVAHIVKGEVHRAVGRLGEHGEHDVILLFIKRKKK